MKLQNILVPTDLSENADRAMRQAVELAAQHGAKLHVFHAITLHAADPARLKVKLEDYVKKVEEEVFADLSERSEEIRRRGVAVEVTLARSFLPFEAIMDKAEEVHPEIVVMGTHGRSGVKKLLMGSVAEKVVRHAPCHVLTVGHESTVAEGGEGFSRILVPVDFSEASKKAIDVARSFLSRDGGLVVAHVVSSPIHPSFYAGGVTRMFQLDPELPERIREKLKTLYGGPGELVVTEGNIVSDVLETAKSHDVDMIVMGTKGLTGLDHLLVGSVTERVIRHASVPVLSIK